MRGTHAWTFKEVTTFLEINLFRCVHIEGSHHYYLGMVAGEETIVEVPFHSSAYIKQGTLEKSIISKSFIPAKEWKAYTRMSPQQRKKYVYEKVTLHPNFNKANAED